MMKPACLHCLHRPRSAPAAWTSGPALTLRPSQQQPFCLSQSSANGGMPCPHRAVHAVPSKGIIVEAPHRLSLMRRLDQQPLHSLRMTTPCSGPSHSEAIVNERSARRATGWRPARQCSRHSFARVLAQGTRVAPSPSPPIPSHPVPNPSRSPFPSRHSPQTDLVPRRAQLDRFLEKGRGWLRR